MDLIDDLHRTTIKLLIREPYYGHFFTYLLREFSERVEQATISCGKKSTVTVSINPVYWKSIPEEKKLGCIKHQVLHIVFGHVFKVRSFGNRIIFDIAADLVVNQYLQESQRDDYAFTLSSFPTLGLAPFQSLDYYYAKLSLVPNLVSNVIGNNTGSSGSNISSSKSLSNDNLGEDTELANSQSVAPELHALQQHKGWDSFMQITDTERNFIEERTTSYSENAARRLTTVDFGSLPGQLQTVLKEAMARLDSVVSWKRLLKIFAESSKKTFLKNTLKRRSKRYGTIPGIKVRQKQKLLVAVDTSGSIIAEELAAFFKEIYFIWKKQSDIQIVHCDVEIHVQYFYKGKQPEFIRGGGGTSFNAPIEYANNIYKPDGIIYFTDGHAEKPSTKSRMPILWVITSNGVSSESWQHLPGLKIKMKAL